MGMFGAIPGGLSSMPDWMKMSMQGQQPQPTAPQSMGAAPPSPQGMFGAPQSAYGPVKGSLSEKLMAIGGVLSQLGGVRNDNLQQYFATLEGRREDQRKAQLAEAARYAPQHIGDNIVRMNPDGKYETLYSAPSGPYRWRANNGDLMEEGPDGKPVVAYADPTEKPNYEWVTDPTTGAKSLYQIPPGVRSAPQGLPPGVTLTPMGGPAPQGSGTFR